MKWTHEKETDSPNEGNVYERKGNNQDGSCDAEDSGEREGKFYKGFAAYRWYRCEEGLEDMISEMKPGCGGTYLNACPWVLE